MKCLVFAYSEIGVEAIETLLDLGETVVGVVTHKDNPAETRWYRSVEELTLKHRIPTITPEDPNSPEVLAWARDRHPEIIFSFYYRKMLKRPLLDLAPLGAYNLHGSLLPKFRGRAPINWAIIEGAKETGLTLHRMVEKPDAGDIVAQEAVPITERETARELFDKVVPVSRRLLTEVVPQLRDGRATHRPQNAAEATYFGARTPADGLIHWAWDATRIHNLVRALTRPYPGAFTYLAGKQLFIWKGSVSAASSTPTAPISQVVSVAGSPVLVMTGKGLYQIDSVGWAMDDSQPAAAILRPGNRLGNDDREPAPVSGRQKGE